MKNIFFENKKLNYKTKTILIHQMISNENLIYIKVVEIMNIYNFDVGHFII